MILQELKAIGRPKEGRARGGVEPFQFAEAIPDYYGLRARIRRKAAEKLDRWIYHAVVEPYTVPIGTFTNLSDRGIAPARSVTEGSDTTDHSNSTTEPLSAIAGSFDSSKEPSDYSTQPSSVTNDDRSTEPSSVPSECSDTYSIENTHELNREFLATRCNGIFDWHAGIFKPWSTMLPSYLRFFMSDPPSHLETRYTNLSFAFSSTLYEAPVSNSTIYYVQKWILTDNSDVQINCKRAAEIKHWCFRTVTRYIYDKMEAVAGNKRIAFFCSSPEKVRRETVRHWGDIDDEVGTLALVFSVISQMIKILPNDQFENDHRVIPLLNSIDGTKRTVDKCFKLVEIIQKAIGDGLVIMLDEIDSFNQNDTGSKILHQLIQTFGKSGTSYRLWITDRSDNAKSVWSMRREGLRPTRSTFNISTGNPVLGFLNASGKNYIKKLYFPEA